MRTKILFLVSIIFLVACSSPQKLYDQGKYDKAFKKTLKELKKKKKRKSRKTVALLNKSFKKIIDEARADMSPLSENTRFGDLKSNLVNYADIADYYRDGRSFLKAESRQKYDQFEKEGYVFYNDLYDEANDVFNKYKKTGDKLYAQDAYLLYDILKTYGDLNNSSNYKALNKLMDESLEAGTVVYNIELNLQFHDLRWEISRQFDRLEGRNGFNVYVFNNSLGAYDCSMVMDFDKIDVDIDENQSSKSYSKTITDGYKEKVDTNGVITKIPIQRKVNGQVISYTTRKTLTWDAIIRPSHRQKDVCNIDRERFRVQNYDEVSSYRTSGDERAIPSKYKTNHNERLEDTDRMADDLIDDLYNKVKRYLYR